jgi:hypothetical protein
LGTDLSFLAVCRKGGQSLLRAEVCMKAPLFLNEAVRSVQWQDLRELTFVQTVRAVLLSAPWLAASLAFAWNDQFGAAIPFSIVFFMAGLRQTHDGFHAKLGLSARWTHAFLLSSPCSW